MNASNNKEISGTRRVNVTCYCSETAVEVAFLETSMMECSQINIYIYISHLRFLSSSSIIVRISTMSDVSVFEA